MTAPPVTVVTPAYNAAPFLRETLDSVLTQDWPDLELIVVDDGSRDDTPAILASYGERIRAVRQANAGEAAAVNAGVALAKSDIVAVVNADDPVRPGLVRAAAEALTADPALVGVYPDWIMIDGEGRELRRVRTLDYSLDAMLGRCLCLPGPGGFFRRSAMGGEAIRDGSARYANDFDFWLRLALKGPLKRIPGYLASWRRHGGGATAGNSIELARNKIEIMERLFARPDVPPEARALETQAKSAAHYRAALHGLYNPAIPGRAWLARSYALKPVWPWRNQAALRRSLLRTALVAASPVFTRLIAATT